MTLDDSEFQERHDVALPVRDLDVYLQEAPLEPIGQLPVLSFHVDSIQALASACCKMIGDTLNVVGSLRSTRVFEQALL